MNKTPCCFLISLLLLSFDPATAQDIEPRRWTVFPAGMNVIGAGYSRLDGDVSFDPVLQIEDATMSGQALGLSYVRSFNVGSKVARLDVVLPWANIRWTGLLDGAPATASRVGLSDPNVRLSMILVGENPDALATSNTVIGAAVAINVPFGEYFEEKLLNLGQNRIYVRPQVGVLHTRGNWSYELTSSVFLYGDNDDFYGGSTLEQDPLYAVQTHLIYAFDKSGYWAALSAGYGWGGQSTLDGNKADDGRRLFLSALAVGVPISKRQGIKLAYVRTRTNTSKGSDIDSYSLGWSYLF
jgi:hypothetical protein